MEDRIKELEERIVSVERRFQALWNSLSTEAHAEIEIETSNLINADPHSFVYTLKFVVETDKGNKEFPPFTIKAWSEKQAYYLGFQDIIYPACKKAQNEGKIRYFKTFSKEVEDSKVNESIAKESEPIRNKLSPIMPTSEFDNKFQGFY